MWVSVYLSTFIFQNLLQSLQKYCNIKVVIKKFESLHKNLKFSKGVSHDKKLK